MKMMIVIMMMMACLCTVLQTLAYDTIRRLRLAFFVLTPWGCLQIPLLKNGYK
jgi:predicted membrane channel-forming protein YqfA (hemolysin III family)